jgi:hypothetical protein
LGDPPEPGVPLLDVPFGGGYAWYEISIKSNGSGTFYPPAPLPTKGLRVPFQNGHLLVKEIPKETPGNNCNRDRADHHAARVI